MNDSPKTRTVFRVVKDKDNPYVMMDKRPIENPNLSWKAKGVLSYLLSRPDDWVINMGDLVKRSTDGAHATRAAVNELIEAGHILRTHERDEKGRITKVVYETYEYPLRVFQEVDNQEVGNRTLNNNDRTNNKNSNKEGTPNGAPPRTSTVQQQMVEVLAALTGMDYHIKSNASRLGKTASELVSSGYKPENVKAFAQYWRNDDWRGRKGDKPKLSQVTELIGVVRGGRLQDLKPDPIDLDGLRRAVREAKPADDGMEY